MKTRKVLFLIAFSLVLTACNLQNILANESSPSQETAIPPVSQTEPQINQTQPSSQEPAVQPPLTTLPPASDPTSLIQPADLEYLGAFRLPDASGTSSWEYSGRGLTFYPEGDPDGPDDGYPGSLFGVGFDQQNHVSEISIPAPVISRNLEDLNTAMTLQPFEDITQGMFGETDLPRLGIQYLPALEGQTEGAIHFVHGGHFQDFEPSHGFGSLDLSNPQSKGPWIMNGNTNYTTSDYIFEIPGEWAATLPGEPRLATGRFREGVWGGLGPALFAYSPLQNGNTPAAGATLTGVIPLLLYGVQEPGATDIVSDTSMQMALYNEDDSWWGAAWLTRGNKAAVIFTGTKGEGKAWYGFANGVVWEYDCAEKNPPTCPNVPEWPYDNRGYWAEDYQPQILFYDPAQLVQVANGELETWQPQPYASMDLSQYFYDPEIDLAEYKYDIAGAATYDRERGLLYLFERLADGYKSVIHVWRIN